MECDSRWWVKLYFKSQRKSLLGKGKKNPSYNLFKTLEEKHTGLSTLSDNSEEEGE